MSFISNSLGVFGTRIFVILISFVGSIFVTRILGPSNRGILEILTILPSLIVSFGNLGIGNANTYFLGKKKYNLEEIVSSSVVLSIIIGTILIFVSYAIFFIFKNSMFKNIPFGYTLITFSVIPFLLFQKYIQYILIGLEDIKARNIIFIMPDVIKFCFLIALVVFANMLISGVLWATFIAYLVTFVICIYFARKKSRIRLYLDFQLYKNLISYGLIPYFALFIMNLNFKADIYLVKYYLDDTSVGLYSLSVSLIEKVHLLPEALSLVLFAKVANSQAQEANIVTASVCRISVLITIVLSLILALIAPIIIPFLYGEAFVASVYPIYILIPGIVFLTYFIILHSAFTGRGAPQYTVYIFSIAFVINMILNVIFIPKWGINGAALASTLSYGFGGICLMYVFCVRYKIAFMDLVVPTKGDFKLIMESIKNRLYGQRKI